MMGGDDYNKLKQNRQLEVARRRDGAAAVFPDARSLADGAGFVLRRCTSAHYQLQRRLGDTEILDIYPGNQHLHGKKGFITSLALPYPWGLLDVVRTVIAKDTLARPES